MIFAGTTVFGTSVENAGLAIPTRGGWTFYQSDTGEVYRALEDGSGWTGYRNLPDTEYVIFTGASGVNRIRFPDATANALEFSAGMYEYLRFDTRSAQRRIDFNYNQEDVDFYVYYDTGVGMFIRGSNGGTEFGGSSVTVVGDLGVGHGGPPAWLVDVRGSDPLVVITNTDSVAAGKYCEVRYRIDTAIYSYIRGGVDVGGAGEGFWAVHTRNGVAYPEAIRVNYLGYLGIGTNQPGRRLHTYVSDSVNNAVTWTNRYSHESSGTITAGHGVGVELTITDTASTQQIAGRWSVVWTNAAAKNADLIFDLMSSGAVAAEKARITDGGDFVIQRDYYVQTNQGLTTSFTTGDARTATFIGGILTGLA